MRSNAATPLGRCNLMTALTAPGPVWLLDEIVANFGAILTEPPDHNPFERKVRPGWFHCSDLAHKPPRIRFSPRRVVSAYLGLEADKQFDHETVFAMTIGTAIDVLLGAALQHSSLLLGTQVHYQDADLRLAGTPDLVIDWAGEEVPGDVKSTGRQTFGKFWANDDWCLSNGYFWRQLQAYLLLAHAERGLFIAVNRAGEDYNRDVRQYLACRWYYRDETAITTICNDLSYCREWVERYWHGGDLPPETYR